MKLHGDKLLSDYNVNSATVISAMVLRMPLSKPIVPIEQPVQQIGDHLKKWYATVNSDILKMNNISPLSDVYLEDGRVVEQNIDRARKRPRTLPSEYNSK